VVSVYLYYVSCVALSECVPASMWCPVVLEHFCVCCMFWCFMHLYWCLYAWAVHTWLEACWFYVAGFAVGDVVTSIITAQYNLHTNAPSSRKLLKMDVLTSETCWAVIDIIKQVSSWSTFIQISRLASFDLKENVIKWFQSIFQRPLFWIFLQAGCPDRYDSLSRSQLHLFMSFPIHHSQYHSYLTLMCAVEKVVIQWYLG